ncbi:hypothetical protein [Thalassomonas sp. RHCl1]|uniref:hypothetical protein n=1 Tax=Thalassomonas sp. RHCl1 TaxID=2995320 RepID=UPI00248BDB11|nr:hypothetical protein [Thalassomonas sp. RHCl1]
MEIKAKIGVDKIYLGMNMTEVRAAWGDPEEISTFIPLEDKPQDRTVDWKYSNGIELCFDSEDDFLITSITCESQQVTINGLLVIGLTSKELRLRFPAIKLDDEFVLAIDEYRHPSLELSFWVQNDRVNAVTIYPAYDESGKEIIWPERNH